MHHLELKAAKWRVEEARAKWLGSGRRSNPELGFEAKHSQDFREASVEISLDQRFPMTARLQLEKAVSEKQIGMAEMEIRDMERKWIAEAQALAIRILATEEVLQMRQQQLDLATKLSEVSRAGAERGEISPLDVSQIQLEAQQIKLDSRKYEVEKLTLLGTLKPFLGLKSGDVLRFQGKLPNVTMPARRNWESRPDYRLSKLKEEASLQGIDLAKSKKWEDLNVGVFVEGERMEESAEGLSNTGFVGLRLSLPLPFWNKNEGEIEEKMAEAQRVKAESKALELEIGHEASLAREEMESYLQMVRETQEKFLPLVVKQTDDLEKAYELGQTDLVTVLRSREQRLKMQASILEASRDFHLARIRYESAVGKHVGNVKK